MALQDNTEDFRADMERFQKVYETPLAELQREKRLNQWLWYTISILFTALLVALFWIGTH